MASIFALLLFALLGLTHGCTDGDTVTKAWNSGRSGYLSIDIEKNGEIDIFMSTAIVSADFYCLKLNSQDGVKFSYTVRNWCPVQRDGKRLIKYSLYFKGPQREHKAHISKIIKDGAFYCRLLEPDENGDCSKYVKKDNEGHGFEDGTFSIPIEKEIDSWKFKVGFDKDVTGFNVNEAQPDPDAKDPCMKINSHKSYVYNKNLKPGTHKFKYYMTYDTDAGEPKIVYFNLGDDKSSTQCGTKPKCP